MKELMIHIEHVVRPVQASLRRKRRMRQELLAHLTSLLEEERLQTITEEQAITGAIRRFGDTAELIRELQASVPSLEQWASQLPNPLLRKNGESAFLHALRLATILSVFSLMWLILLPALLVVGGANWHNVWLGFGPIAMVLGYLFLAALMCYGLCWECCGRRGRWSLVRISAYGIGAIFIGLSLVVVGNVVQPDNALWGFMLYSTANPMAFLTLCWFAITPLIVALAAVAVVRTEKARLQADQDWSSLAFNNGSSA